MSWYWRWRLKLWAERLQTQLVWSLPKWLIYWAVIRCWANGTTGNYGTTHPDELTWGEALRRWTAGREANQ